METSAPPFPIHFRSALVTTLGRAVDFKPAILTDIRPLRDSIIRLAGYDPDRLGSYGDPAAGWRRGGTNGFNQKIRRECAYIYAPTGYVDYLVYGGFSRWGLTPEGGVYAYGVLVASEKAHAALGTRNATARFFEKRLKATGGINGSLWKLLRAAIAHKLRVSEAAGLGEDHIQTALVRLIHRDALAKRLQEGVPIPDGQLVAFVLNSARNDIRDFATDPVTRELLGARTGAERAAAAERAEEGEEDMVGTLSDSRLMWDRDDRNDRKQWTDVADTDGPLSATALEGRLEFNDLWARIERIIQRKKRAREAARYVSLLRLRAAGFTIVQIAAKKGMTANRATMMIQEACRAVKEAHDKELLS